MQLRSAPAFVYKIDMSGNYANGSDGGDADCVSVGPLTAESRWFGRLQELREFYSSQFGTEPQFYVRVPGRVNIIGEHVDYCGYPVLPMAIDQCICLAVGAKKGNTTLKLINFEKDKFVNFEGELKDLKVELPKKGGPEWYKYFLCGIKGIYEALGVKASPIGMTVALSGNIPPASGLSSSSALVSAAALATAYVHAMPLDCKHLASISANCERYIGTQGGGMDQAIAYLAKEGCAQFIEFQPKLTATSIQLPEGACFVVANSLAEVNKAASSDFNERVVECRLGSRLIAKQKGLSHWQELLRFSELQQALKCSLSELETLAMEHLTQDSYTRQQVIDALQTTEQEFAQDFLTPNTRQMRKFKLRQRALHVIQESLRVERFRRICELSLSNGAIHANGDQLPSDKLANLSQLMRASHRSLKDLYECSHPNLDRLIAISDSLGVGARLTGAGWGGCIVALCDSPETAADYIRALKHQYFAKLPTRVLEAHQHNDFEDVIFATFPRSGSEVFQAKD